MPSHHDPVRPIPFEVVKPAPPQGAPVDAPTSAAHRGTPAWVLPVMGLLLLLAMLVVFMLPALLSQDSTPTPAANAPAAVPAPVQSTAGAPAPADAEAAPWSDAQQARARRETQDVLQPLLDLQFALQQRGVEQWAGGEFTRAKGLAAEGDALYKNREYDAALTRYKDGMAALQALEASQPQVLERLLVTAREALAAGDATAAQAALATAALLAPDNAEIPALRKRAEVLPEVLPLLEQARAAEASGDLPRAQTLLQQVLALDAGQARAQQDLQRIAASLSNRGFNAAMSEGYAALKAGQFDSARKAFSNAAKLQPGSREAASALQEVANAQSGQRLAGLQREGERAEQREQWPQAVAAYEQARKIDSSVVFAREGLARTQARAALDKQLRAVIDDPLRLSDTGVAAGAWRLLAEAKQVSARGPVLGQQITQLETALRQAETKIDIALRSDNATEVTLYKVARLGRFQEKALALRPGNYTAVGTRDGFRDVRQTFTVKPGVAPAPVTVVCSERI